MTNIISSRYCKGDGLLDQLKAVLNVNMSHVAELITRSGTGLFFEAGPMFKEAQNYINNSPPNYYEGCKSFVGILQLFTDQNVNN